MNASVGKDFLAEDRGSQAPFARARVHLAAFGKHPGWNDHIDDLGFETRTLIQAKKLIYLEGISSQIDTGAWERLEPAAQFASFDHFFVWVRGDELLLGLLVDSRDGKGRTRYPMVLCLHAMDVTLEKAIGDFCPVLESAMAECRAVTTAGEVVAILDRARAALREKSGGPPALSGAPESIAGQPALGPDDEGLFRVLYQMRSQFAAWAPGKADLRSGADAPRAAHLRVPQVFAEPARGWPLWLNAFRSQLDPAAPLLLLWPRHADWADLIAGIPEGADFFALRAATKAIPLATEVPYQIDDAFRAEARAIFPDLGRASPGAKTIFGAAPAPGVRVSVPKLETAKLRATFAGMADRVKAWATVPGRPKILLAVAAMIVAAGLATMLLSRRPPAPPKREPETVRAKSGAAVEVPETWHELCENYFDWGGAFQSALASDARRPHPWRENAELQRNVIGPFERSLAELKDLDPQLLTKAPSGGRTLADNPPASLTDPQVRRKVARAAQLLRDTGRALTEWPMLSWLEDQQGSFKNRGWNRLAQEIAELRAGFKLDKDLPTRIDAVLAREDDLKKVVAEVDNAAARWNDLRASHDPFLVGWAQYSEAEAAGAQSIDDLNGRLRSSLEGAEQAHRLLDPALGIDWTAFRRNEAERFGTFARELVRPWMETAQTYARWPEAERPLPEAAWRALIDPLTPLLERLKPTRGGAKEFADRLERLRVQYAAYRDRRALRRDAPALKAEAVTLQDDVRALAADMTKQITLRFDPTTWMLQVRSIAFSESRVIEQEWVKHREALLTRVDPGALAAEPGALPRLQEQVTQVQRFLKELVEASPASEVRFGDPFARELRTILTRERQNAWAELLKLARWENDVPAMPWADFARGEGAATLAHLERTQNDATDFAREAANLMSRLDRAEAWGQFAGEAKRWSENPAREIFRGVPFVGDVQRRLDALQRVADERDRSRLAAALTTGDVASRLTAWRALAQLPDWPANRSELEAAAAGRNAIRDAARGMSDAARRGELLALSEQDGRRQWLAFLDQAAGPADWEAAFELREKFEIAPDALPRNARYNDWLYRMKRKGWDGFNATELPRERATALAELRSNKVLAELAADQPWIQSIDTLSLNDPPVDRARLGPGGKNWKLLESGDPTRLVYGWQGPKREHRLEFVLLEPVGDRAVYLSTTEMPVGLFIDWCASQGLWKDVFASVREFIEDSKKTMGRHNGPGTYSYPFLNPQPEFEIARAWMNSGFRYDGKSPAPPGELTPINYVSHVTADLLAKSLNCRLPTKAEWTKANAMEPDAARNLRDATWKQVAALNELADWDVYSPKLGSKGTNDPVTDANDGLLWFGNVNEGGGRRFHHLVGNVAEIVTDDEAKKFMVIGASALSPKEIEPLEAYPVEANDRRGYSDVGFRLAFSVQKLSPGQVIARYVHDAPYRPNR